MKAVKRPVPITVVEIADATIVPEGVLLRGRTGGTLEVYNKLHDTWIGCEMGDYLNITNVNDVYPINRATFESTYDIVPYAE